MQRLGGVGYILTCTEINSHPIVKPFEMGAYWGVMKRSIFLFDHRMFASWDFGHFSKTFDKNWLLVPQNQSKKNFKKFSKKSKKWWKIFSLFLFLSCSIECIVLPRLDTMSRNPFLPPLYSQKIRQITFWKWCENL